MTPSADSSTETLLAHAGWMRALALGLVRDPHAADDVAQDAALAALLHPPPADAALRPWLNQVVRRLAWRRARSERRRGERELCAREPAGPEEASETLERLDLQRALLDAVRALEEPVRTTLVQRYFEGRSAAEIAAASGVPASTVRARTVRGLELLRERLDRETGSRAAWMALVAPLLPRELAPVAPSAGAVAASSLATGALTMTLAKLALVAGAVLVGGLAWWNLTAHDPRNEPVALAPLGAPTANVAPITTAAAPVGNAEAEQRVPVVVAAPTSEPEPASTDQAAEAEPEKRGSFDARIVDERGGPWADAELRVYRASELDEQALARGASGSDGRIQIEVVLPKWARNVGGASFELVVRRAGCASRHLDVVVRDGETTHLGEIVLLESGSVRGRVVDELGRPVADAHVGALAAAELASLDATESDRLARTGSDRFDALLARGVDGDGGFALDDVPRGPVVLWAHAPDRRYVLSGTIDLESRAVVEGVILTLAELGQDERIAGRVLGPDGVGRHASLGRIMRSSKGTKLDSIETDMQGRFAFPAAHLDSVYELTAHDGYDQFPPELVGGVRPGAADVVIAFGGSRKLTVRLRDSGGDAVEGAEFWIQAANSAYVAKARTLAPGEYEIDCPGGPLRVDVEALGFRGASSPRYRERAVPEVIELRLLQAPCVRGTVSAEGRPLAGAKVESFAFDSRGTTTVNDLRCIVSSFENGACTSDAQGRFELFVDADGPIVVRASAAGWVDAESEPFEASGEVEPLALELGRGGAIEGRVLVPAGESLGGRIVGVHRGDGRPRTTRTAEDGTFRFEGLMPGAWHVLQLAEDFAPGQVTYSSTSSTEPLPSSCRVEEGRTTRFDLELAGG